MSEAKTEMNEEKNRGHPMNSTTILVSFGFPPRAEDYRRYLLREDATEG